MRKDISEQNWWWIAINGASCAAAGIPNTSPPTVVPTPEQLIGFRTREEQLAAQQLILKEPIEQVREYMQSLGSRVEAGEVRYFRPNHPEPPTRGSTQWIFEDGKAGSQTERDS